MSTLSGVRRLDANRLVVDGPVPATIYANAEVPIDAKAVAELKRLLGIQETVQKFYARRPELFSTVPSIEEVVLTPDFHKGSGIPIGTVMKTRGFAVPQAVGNDVNCGVRLHRTGLKKGQVLARRDELETALRRVFFEGKRDIALTRAQRLELLAEGLDGLFDTPHPGEGIWTQVDLGQLRADLDRVRSRGSFAAGGVYGVESYVGDEGVSRDSTIGSIGGGNHFVELQAVKRVIKGTTAHGWGLREGEVVVMVHSGSLGLGHGAGGAAREGTRGLYPGDLKAPENGIYPLPDACPEYSRFQTAFKNAANFAFANRMFLGQMVRVALRTVLGDGEFPLLYDSPHNYAWAQPDGRVVHRKGACPARGLGQGCDEYFGEVVLVPGSMGTSSFVLEGLGNPGALHSACHGAGRLLSRGEALRRDEVELDAFLEDFRVVTPVDPSRPELRGRRDILEKWRDDLRKEAPAAYKDIYPVVDTLRDARVADPVAELEPLLTLKS